MNAIATFFAKSMRRAGAPLAAALWLGAAALPAPAAPSFIYETPNEFLASGDFNGDGVLDALVLDKLTGNARVGYSDTNGNLTWSSPLPTGVGDAAGCGIGRLLQTTRDAVAVTAPTQNRVNLVDLSGTNTPGAPIIVTPTGLGPHTVVALADASGGVAPAYNDLLAASSDNSDSAELLDLMGISAGAGTEVGEFSESAPFDRGNALQLSVTPATFATGIARGPTNDTLHVWQFTNLPSVMLAYSNLPSGSDYAFGIFDNETLPRFLFYQPGASNVTVVSLAESGGVFSFGTTLGESLSEAIQGVFYVPRGTGGSFMIVYSNGVQSLRFPGGTPVFSTIYSAGAGAAGNAFTGLVPLAGSDFALLDAPPGGTASVHAQVVHFDGTNFTQLSSGNLPSVTSRTTRANVWVFLTEPFVNRSPGFIASFNTPDWSDSVSGLPGSLSVVTEDDAGASAGLGSPGTDALGVPPVGSYYGLPNQYGSAISVFSYNNPQPAEPVTVTISPPPGIYDGPINISFTTLNASDKVFYRVGSGGSWQQYVSLFPLTNDNTIQYWGTNTSAHTRSVLLSAAYSLGINGQPTPTVNLGSGSTSTNPPPIYSLPTNIIISPLGTVFYGRRSPTNTGSIWAINYDGSDDLFITTGVRPRASRDGKWIAFMRGAGSFQGHGNVWLRNVQSGQETLLFNNPGTIECYDWKLDNSGIILDYGCGLYYLGTNGVMTPAEATDCYEQAPVFNPIDGRLALHDLNPGGATADGIYVATSGISNLNQIVTTIYGASWPAWSPDGLSLAFVDENTSTSLDTGTNLYVVAPTGTNLSRICDFYGTSNRFPHGALWSPDSSSLVGAATLEGTNGIWIVPLNPDRTDCEGAAMLLPTTPGDAIDFVGSIIVAGAKPPPPLLAAFSGTNGLSIYWTTNLPSLTLEYTTNIAPPIIWYPILGPYTISGLNYLYTEPFDTLVKSKFFRLTGP